MVGFSAVGFALTVVVVLEFCPACWAVCDAHLLCSCEYLFSELFVFSCACSAHRVSSSCVWCVVLGGGASQRQRDERLHRPNTTLFLPSFFFSLRLSFFVFLVCRNGVCCVVRAQPSEHARNTTRAIVCCVCLLNGVRVVPTTQCSLLTIAVLNVEHSALLITL